jgi:hypothetical protein
MAEKYKSNSNLEDLTDYEIYDAIRYLDPDPRHATEDNGNSGVVICVGLWMVLLGCLGFLWLYW